MYPNNKVDGGIILYHILTRKLVFGEVKFDRPPNCGFHHKFVADTEFDDVIVIPAYWSGMVMCHEDDKKSFQRAKRIHAMGRIGNADKM